MSVPTLKESIRILYDMELNNYAMNDAIAQLNYRINKLGKKKDIPYRKNVDCKEVEYKSVPLSWLGESYVVGLTALLGVIIGAIVAMVDIFGSNDNFILKIIAVIPGIIWFGIKGGVIGLAIGTVLFLLCRPFYKKEESNKNEARKIEMEEIQKEKERLHKMDVEEDLKRVYKEQKEKEYLINQRDMLIAKKKESEKKLFYFYYDVGIDKKYRNIVPMGYMYEFIRLGIATKLEGSDGLYYLIRKELRDDELRYTLNEISNKLDILIDNSRDIYADLNAMNNKCDKMIASTEKSAKMFSKSNQMLSQIAENSSVAAYTAQRIESEAKFTNYMMLWDRV